jgi:hypothetical protein
MLRSALERSAVAAVAFVAAATWLGVGLTHGLACLLVAGIASLGTRAYQRRSRVDARRRSRRPVAETRRAPSRPRPEPLESDFDWPTAGDAAW